MVVSAERPDRSPLCEMSSPMIPTSARKAGAPVPSTISPPTMRTSKSPGPHAAASSPRKRTPGRGGACLVARYPFVLGRSGESRCVPLRSS